MNVVSEVVDKDSGRPYSISSQCAFFCRASPDCVEMSWSTPTVCPGYSAINIFEVLWFVFYYSLGVVAFKFCFIQMPSSSCLSNCQHQTYYKKNPCTHCGQIGTYLTSFLSNYGVSSTVLNIDFSCFVVQPYG